MPISDTLGIRLRGVHTFAEKGKKALFLLILIFFITAVSYGNGQKEDRLSQARDLIEDRLYNEAVLVLAEVMTEEPNKFDEAQQLLQQVRNARKEYNDRYNDLIELYQGEVLDMEEAYRIFRDLEDLDQSPNKATVEAFEKARQTAVFVFNNNRFNNIMDEAAGFIERGDYWKAVETYLTGFDLYIEEYEKQDYGNIVENRIAEAKAELSSVSERFINTRDEFTQLLEDNVNYYRNGNLSALENNWDRLSELFLSTFELRQTAREQTEFFREQNLQIIDGGSNEEFHLTFLNLLAKGREKSEGIEGIIPVIDTVWKGSLRSVEERMVEGTKTSYALAKEQYDTENYETASEQFSSADRYSALSLRTLQMWELFVDFEANLGLEPSSRELVRSKLPHYNSSEIIADASDMYRTVIPLSLQIEELNLSIPEGDTVDEVYQIRDRITSILRQIEQLENLWLSKQVYYERVAERELGTGDTLSVGEETLQALRDSTRLIEQTEIAAVDRFARIRFAPLYSKVDQLTSIVNEGLTLLNGYERTTGEGETATTYVVKDPLEGKKVFESVVEDIDDVADQTKEVVEALESEKPYIVAGEQIRTHIDKGEDLIKSVGQLSGNVTDYIAKAEEQILLAERYQNEANFRISQAESALNGREFDRARNELRIAADRFDRSLAIQDDPELRETRNQRISELNEEINTVENNIIVAEVRELIEEGKTLYAQEQYAEAERNFLKAQSRWKVTHAENKPEIDYWLGILRIALNIKSGREIDETNPLYPEMRRYLNLANQDFLQGKELVEDGKEGEAAQYFEAADQKLLYVKMAFPLNREASVLSLKIEQYRDLENFSNLFRQRFNQARNKLTTNPQEAYIELKDLEAINPDFPGMNNALYNAEIRLGIRIPPPDPAKIEESNKLYQQAYNIVQSNVRSQFPIALEYLNQAIKLTPNSQQLTNLLDRIEAELGGRSTLVLASGAQQQYKLAEEKYLEGSFYEALRIVNNLMKDEKSSQYPPLLELKRRIESKI